MTPQAKAAFLRRTCEWVLEQFQALLDGLQQPSWSAADTQELCNKVLSRIEDVLLQTDEHAPRKEGPR